MGKKNFDLFWVLAGVGWAYLAYRWWIKTVEALLLWAAGKPVRWGPTALLLAGLFALLYTGHLLFEKLLIPAAHGSFLGERTRHRVVWLGVDLLILVVLGWLTRMLDLFYELNVEHLPAGVQLRFVLAGGIPLLAFCTALIWAGWRWGERLRAAEETADADEQRSLADRRMRFALSGVGRYALLTAVWLLLFAAAWWVRTRFFS